MSESRLQEIVTRAVVGRAERRMSWSHTVPAEGVTDVLGVRVTDWTVAVKEQDGYAVIDLLADCDLWCGNEKNTKVIRCTCRHGERVEVRTVGRVLGETDLRARILGSPRATGVKVHGGQIAIAMDGEVAVEVTALARVWVKAYDMEDEVLEDLDDSDGDCSSSSSDSGSGE